MSLNDPQLVAEEYADERGLLGRRAAYGYADGPDAREVAFEAVREAAPARVLEVSERFRRELGATVVAVDISPRMVELARRRGVDAQVGDVQELPFEDGTFDLVLAALMLYHVPDVARGAAEIARVLRSGGRAVVVTNARGHLHELRELLGAGFPTASFSDENAEEILGAHFAPVDRRDAFGWINFPDGDAVARYVDSSRMLKSRGPPASGVEALRVRREPIVYVAEKPA